MDDINNWDDITEIRAFSSPDPGGYIVKITDVKDFPEKKYLKIYWDFCEGQWVGSNEAFSNRLGFWPTAIIRSYKPKALPFFKAFKTDIEHSNPGYKFSSRNVRGLIGRTIGVVLGQEEYVTKNGELKKRLFVFKTLPVSDIQNNRFTVPAIKRLNTVSAAPISQTAHSYPDDDWSNLPDDDGELPF